VSEIAIPPLFQPRTHPVPARRVDLMTFAEEASAVRRIAQVLCQTDFVPDAYRGRPDEVTAVILFGRELDVGPMLALQTINVIKGRPSLSANLMRGLAQKLGVIFEVVEQSDEKVVMRARVLRHENWTYSTWDLARARKADLLRKEMWQKYPRSMMLARCTSELCRLVAADALMGMPYSTEELNDMASPDTDEPTEEKPKKTVRRKAVYEPPQEMDWPTPEPIPSQPEPPQMPVVTMKEPPDSYSTVDDEGRVGPEVRDPKPDAISLRTRTALQAAFTEQNIRDRSKRLERITQILKREVLSVNQLSEAEGKKVIAVMLNDRDGWPQKEPVAE
jgi:hypothetical protein